jgi:hypothetical protein
LPFRVGVGTAGPFAAPTQSRSSGRGFLSLRRPAPEYHTPTPCRVGVGRLLVVRSRRVIGRYPNGPGSWSRPSQAAHSPPASPEGCRSFGGWNVEVTLTERSPMPSSGSAVASESTYRAALAGGCPLSSSRPRACLVARAWPTRSPAVAGGELPAPVRVVRPRRRVLAPPAVDFHHFARHTGVARVPVPLRGQWVESWPL